MVWPIINPLLQTVCIQVLKPHIREGYSGLFYLLPERQQVSIRVALNGTVQFLCFLLPFPKLFEYRLRSTSQILGHGQHLLIGTSKMELQWCVYFAVLSSSVSDMRTSNMKGNYWNIIVQGEVTHNPWSSDLGDREQSGPTQALIGEIRVNRLGCLPNRIR